MSQLWNSLPGGRVAVGWLVVLGFNATLTVKVISWRSVTHMCFLAFSHHYEYRFLSKATERRKNARTKVRLNRVSNSQPPGLESDTLTTELPVQGWGWGRRCARLFCKLTIRKAFFQGIRTLILLYQIFRLLLFTEST